MARVICFDIDGVLTEDTDTSHEDLAGSYTYRKPRHRAIDLCLRAYEAGWYVLLYTGRRESQRRLTEDWLHERGIHYHALMMGKPYFSYVIDDRVLGVSVDQQLDEFEKFLGGPPKEEFRRFHPIGIHRRSIEEQRKQLDGKETKAGPEA